MLNLADPLSELHKSELSKFKIGHSEVYQFDCTLIKNDNLGDNEKCICGLFKLSSNGIDGWAEYTLPDMNQHFDLIHWASVFMHLKGLPIDKALHFVQNMTETWGSIRTAIAEAALIDLSANLQNPSSSLTLERSFLFTRSQAYFSF